MAELSSESSSANPNASSGQRSSTAPAAPRVPGVIRAVEWRAVFPILNLFRTFRMAIHPSKLLLALVFILLMYGLGRSLDAVWPSAHTYPQVDRVLQFLPESTSSSLSSRPKSGPFDVLLKFQLTQLQNVSESVVAMDLRGVVQSVFNFVFVGPGWGFRNHPVFSVIFGVFLLLGWALFGGAISRVAAVHFARDEKISIRNALRFSSGKLLSFITAPVILAIFIGSIGLAIAITNLLFYIPWGIGPILVGAVFILTMLAGFVLTLAIFGTFGGFGLMYPTVAVEGSDAFDAISRSFSYFFARPWRLVIYTLAALVYGVITYLLVKFFVFVMFVLIQTFQLWFLNDAHRQDYAQFFPPVRFEALSYQLKFGDADPLGLKIGAGILSFWFYLVVGLLGAYAMSYYFSAQTIIYYLLRQDVDATELDDVYLEEADEEDLAEQALPDADRASPSPSTPNGPPAAQPPSVSLSPDPSEDPPTLGASGPST